MPRRSVIVRNPTDGANMTSKKLPIPVERIESAILLIRGEKVLLDKNLALLHGVSTSVLNKAVTRNIDRFPPDFMFQLTKREFSELRFHFGISSWGGTRKLPRAFTEQGVAMLSGILKSERAVRANVEIMRAFAKLRRMLVSNDELARKLEELEKKYDEQFRVVFEAIRQLMTPPERERKKISFVDEPGAWYGKGKSGGMQRPVCDGSL
jgi:hypothetical protein